MRTLPGLLLASSIALGAGCNKEGSGGMPECLAKKLALGGADCVTKVEEHLFRGEKVYRQVVSGCADYPTEVVNSRCEMICSCCGITGIPTGPTEEFARDAAFVKVVWER
ncbi:MAG: hypothetical protein IPL52_12730 [Flavobacteriales bacterium]|nr:hypothetical protein [Flavobacteriales bacterium]